MRASWDFCSASWLDWISNILPLAALLTKSLASVFAAAPAGGVCGLLAAGAPPGGAALVWARAGTALNAVTIRQAAMCFLSIVILLLTSRLGGGCKDNGAICL